MNNLYLYFWIYILLLIWIAFFISLKENKEDFLISWRDRKWWTIMASKFAWSIWMWWFITYSWYAYKYWLWVYIVIIWFILWYTFFAFWAVPKIFKIARENKFYTQWDLVYYYLKNKLSRNITNYFSVIVQFTWLLVSIIGWAKIIDSLWIMSYELALVFTLITVLIYVILAWYKAVLITDIFQSFIILILLFLLSFNIFWSENIIEIIKVVPGQLSIASIIWFFLYWIFSFLAMSDRYQLVYASKTQKDIKRWIFFTSIPLCITAMFIILIGLFVYKQNPNLDPDMVFLTAITTYLPQNLLSIWVVLLFAWLMSSADTYIYAISSHIVLNKHREKNPIKKIRLVIFILLIITWIISYFFRDIIWVTIISAWLSMVMSIPMIYIIKWWKNKNRFLFSVFWSLVWFILWIWILWLEPSAAIMVLIWGLVWLIKK